MERQSVNIGSEIFPPLALALGERVAQSTCPRRQSPEGGKDSRKGDQQPFLFWGTRLFCLYLVVVLGTQEAKFVWADVPATSCEGVKWRPEWNWVTETQEWILAQRGTRK